MALQLHGRCIIQTGWMNREERGKMGGWGKKKRDRKEGLDEGGKVGLGGGYGEMYG